MKPLSSLKPLPAAALALAALTPILGPVNAQAVADADVLIIDELNEQSDTVEYTLRESVARASNSLAENATSLNKIGNAFLTCKAENGLIEGDTPAQDQMAGLIRCHVDEASETAKILADMTDTMKAIASDAGETADIYADLADQTDDTVAKFEAEARARRVALEKKKLEAKTISKSILNPDADLSHDLQMKAIEIYSSAKKLENQAASYDRRVEWVKRQKAVYLTAQIALQGIERDAFGVGASWSVLGDSQRDYIAEIQLASSVSQLETDLEYLNVEVGNLATVINGFDALFRDGLKRPELPSDSELPPAPPTLGGVSDDMRAWFEQLSQ